MNAVPFKFDNMYEGFADGHGLIRDEGTHVSLEFQIQDSIVGLVKSGIKHVQIPVNDLAAVRLERRWFGLVTKIVLQASRMDVVKDVPGMVQGKLELGIARKDRDLAKQFVDGLHVAESRMD